MPQISSLSFNVSFEAHNPNRVGLSNTTPSLPAGFVGIFKVTQPDGYVRNGDIDNPDVTNLVSSCYVTLVPDSAGQLQQGQYTIEFIGNAPGYLSTSFIRTFTLQYTAASISLRNDFDVFTPHLAYTDISNYNVSGYTIASGPTRNWTATSATTGAITSTNSSIDIKKNNQYYAETYVIQFGVTVSYLSQAYPWLTLSHTRSQSTTVTACVPKSLEDLTQLIEALREESNASCGGDWARFEKANSLYVHLINMLRLVLIAGQHQDGFFDVYQQLLSYLQNGSVACDSIGQVIPPYDFSDYESSIYDGQASYCQLVGDGVNTVYRVNHQLGDECVVVQVYEVATGKQVFCDLAVSTINSIDITFYEPPTLNQYRVVAVAGAIGIRGQGFQPGGLTGQLLRKRTNADFDTEWADVTVALPYLVPYTGATQSVYLGEYGVEAGFVRFDTTPTATPAVPAVMSWNDADGTVDLRLKGNNVSLQVGQEMVARVVNKTGANLLESQYKAVRIRKVSEGGAQGQRLAVVLAQANTEFASTDMLGIVTENITNNEEGFITTFGTVRGINTTGSLQGETWADGDILFLSPTVPGGLTKVKPSAPNHLSIVGYVEYAHQNNGKIFVHVQTSWEIDELHNVSISSPVTNQTLVYNSGTGLWENSKLSLHALSNVFVSSPQPNQALVYTGGGWQNQTLSFVSSVGLATTTPGVTITDTPVTGSGVININIATASASTNGLLSTSDWATFNAKQAAISLTTTGSSGPATFVNNVLNIPTYSLSSLGGVPSSRTLTINGTAYDLSADRAWSVGTVTSVAALTIGTAGTDISSTVANGTTTPAITLNIPTASAANRGALSAADWTTFNSKVSGSGTTNYVPKFTAGSTIGNSQIFDNGARVGIGTASPAARLDIRGSGLQDLYFISTTITNVENTIQSYYNNGGAWADLSTKSQNLIFNTGPLGGPQAERLRITSGGDVGIGTTSPTTPLTVNGRGTFTDANGGVIIGQYLSVPGFGGIYSTQVTPSGSNYNFLVSGTNTYISSPNGFIRFDNAGTERMRIFANGRVFIGASPTDAGYLVNINGTLNVASNYAYFGGDSNTAVYMGSFSTEGRIGVGGRSTFPTADLTFYTANGTNNFERMRVSSAGNVGIGTASPAQKLDISGTARVNGGTIYAQASGTESSGYQLNAITIGYDATAAIGWITAGGAAARTSLVLQQSGGNVLIGTATASSNGLLQVNGNIGLSANSQVRQSTNADGGTLQFFGTQFVASNLNSNSYGYTGGAFVASVTSNDNLTPFEAGRIAATGGKFRIVNTTSENTYISLEKNSATTLYANTSNGNVGIGTASPSHKLDVTGAVRASTDLYLGIASSSTGRGYFFNSANTNRGEIYFDNSNNNFRIESTYGGSGTSQPISFWTGFAERLRITSGGNVGIGITDPESYLTGGRQLVVANTPGAAGMTIRTSNTGDGSIFFSDGTTGDETYRGYVQYIHASDALRLGTSATERLRIFANGRVGINTTTDAGYQLDVNGSARAGSVILQANSPFITGSNISSASSLAVGSSSGFLSLHTGNDIMQFNTNGSERMRITASGNVGIGTASPAEKLDVTSTLSRIVVTSTTNSNNAALYFNAKNSGGTNVQGGVYFIPAATPYLSLSGDNSGTHLNVTSAGNVGIGTASPNARLSVSVPFANNGDIGTLLSGQTGATTVGSINTVVESTTTGATAMTFSTLTANSSVSEKVRITNAGNVGIGTQSPAFRLDVRSSVNDVAYLFSSAGGGSNLVFADANTVSAPKIGASGDQLFFTTNGTVQARINTSGNLLLGTTNNLARLTVQNSASTDVAHFSTTTAGAYTVFADGNTTIAPKIGALTNSIVFNTASTGSVTERVRITSGGDLVVGQTSDGFSGAGRALFGLNGTTSSLISMRYGGTSAGYIVANSAAFEFSSNNSLPLVLSTSGTERMRIFNSGRVFIGASPTDAGYQLDVNGNTRVTGKIDISANDSFGLNIVRPGTSAIAAQIYNNGGANGWMLYGVESSAGGVIFSGTEAYASVIGSYNNYSLQMVTNNAVRMTVTGGGSVGIGVASPSASAVLQVDSTTKGMLPPRMTTTQRDAITSPATGLIVYDTTVNKISVYNGTSWRYAQYE